MPAQEISSRERSRNHHRANEADIEKYFEEVRMRCVNYKIDFIILNISYFKQKMTESKKRNFVLKNIHIEEVNNKYSLTIISNLNKDS